MNIRTRTFLAGLLLAAVVGTNTAPVLADPILEDDAAGEAPATAPTPDPSTTVPTTAPPTTVPPTTAPPATVAPTTVPVPTVPSTVEAPAPPPPTAGSNREASAAAEATSAPVPLKSVHAGVSIYDPEWPHNDSCSGIVVPAGQVLYQFVGSSLDGATIAGTTLTSATWGVSQQPTTISGGSARWLVTTSFTSTPLDMYFTTDGTTSRTSELRVGFSCSGAVATTGSLTIAKAVAGFGIPANPGSFTIAYDNGAGNSGSVSVVAGSSQTVSGLPPGTYTISEPNPPAGVDVSFAPAASVTVTAGNTTSVTVTNTYRDVTDPTVDLRTPPEGAVYDRFQAVVADFSCADEAGGSGIDSCVGTVADGAAVPTGTLGSHEFTVTATDEAGNTATVTHTYRVRDVTGPTVDLRTPADGAVYDRFQAVTADFSCADESGGSGIDTCVGTVPDGDAVPTGTLGSHEFTVTATDDAGNTTTVTHTYRVRDVTDPTVDLRTPPEGAVYDRFQAVTADFSCADESGGSGIDTCVGTVADGAAVPTGVLGSHEFTVKATDNAGNETTVTHTYRVRDVTDPTVDLRTPPEGAVYDRSEVVIADFSCADEDGGSGIESCVGTVPDGDAVPTGVLGTHEFTVTATDDAGNTTTVTHTYRVRDVTDPTVDLRTPPEGAVYDRFEPVTADFSCADEDGGSGIESCVGTVADGAAVPTGTLGSHEFTVTATDDAGNTTTVTHSYRVRDVTAPTVDLRTPPEGAVYDRFQAVTADFSCADEAGGSGIESCVGTVADGAAVPTGVLGSHEFTVKATDNAGNETTVTHSYRVRDVTDPTVDLRTPAEGAVYDRSEVVIADFSCADESGGSGIGSCVGTVPDGDAVATGTLGSHEFTVTATDEAGNVTTVTHTYRVRDVTDPTVDLRTPLDGAVYDRFEPVTADFSCADEAGGSGIDTCVGTVPDGDAVPTGTLGSHEFTVTATDEAGNETTVTHTYRVRDVTDPTVDLRTPAEGAVYDRSEVVVADFSCADENGGSGIESCVGTVPDGDAVATGTLGSHEFTVTATDEAGNVTTVTHTYRVRDVTGPTVDLRTPADGAVYDRFEAVVADFSCADEDGGSGVDTCVGTVPDGDAVATGTLGSHEFTVTATDDAGNTTTVTHTYRVRDVTDPTVDLRTPPEGAVYDRFQAVTADFSCADEAGGSGIDTCVGTVPDGDAVPTGTLGSHEFTVTATDDAGNTTTVTHSYRVRDVTAPTVDLRTPPEGAVYDRSEVVVADFSCADEDGGSGVDTCVGTVPDGDAVATGTLGSHEFTVTATDEAGNVTTVTHTYRVRDVTDPTVDLRTPPEGAVYDRFQAVTADFSCADEDGGSGVDTCVGTVPDGDAVATGTLGSHEFTVTATDDAGNTTTVTHSYRVRDVTAPTVDLRSPLDGAVRDRFQRLVADFSCEDEAGGSGIASCVGAVPDGDAVDTSAFGSLEFTVTATDNAGNTTTVTHTVRVEDLTPPIVTLNTPVDGATYDLNSSVSTDFSCEDPSGSGIESCVGQDGGAESGTRQRDTRGAAGDPLDTSSPGTRSFTAIAVDRAGNSTAVTHTYTVAEAVPPPPAPPDDAVAPVPVPPPAVPPPVPPAPRPEPGPGPGPVPTVDDGECVSGIEVTAVQVGSPVTFVGPGALTSDHQVWIDDVPMPISIDGATLLVATDQLRPGTHRITAACRGEVLVDQSLSVFLGVGSTGTAGGLGGFFGIFIVFLSTGFLWRAGALSLAGLLSMRTRAQVGAAAAALVALAFLSVSFMAPPHAAAAEDGEVTIESTVNGRPIEGATSNDPVRLYPDEPTTIGVTVHNGSDEDLRVGRVRLSGTSLGLTLIAYDIPVPLDVPAGEDAEVEIPLVLFDLDRQANGLVPGTVSIYDDTGTVVADESFTLDIRGSLTSVMGLFGGVILLATLISLVVIGRHIATRTLPPSRFRRALRFGLTGVGIGLTMVIALAGLRIAAAEGEIWVPFALVPGLIGFVLGFISPGVLKIEDDEVDEAREELIRGTTGTAVGTPVG